MRQSESELELAEAEVDFWRDYVYWWEARYGAPVEPRVLEALANAEKRCTDARESLPVAERYG